LNVPEQIKAECMLLFDCVQPVLEVCI